MASWIIHLRVAELIANTISISNNKTFLIGNVAPDSGSICADKMSYLPAKHISHWFDKDTHEYLLEDFYRQYLTCPHEWKEDFYLGYYCHLITDSLWKEKIYVPTVEKHLQDFESKKDFVWAIKKDWYQVDVLYLREFPQFEPYKILKSIEDFPNDYFDYFSADAIYLKIREIVEEYHNATIDENYDYPYLNFVQATEFVNEAVGVICKHLLAKNYTGIL